MQHLPSILATLVALVPLACGGSEDDDGDRQSASALLGELDGHVTELSETAQSHTTAVRAAADLSQVTVLEQEHAMDMGHHLEEMEHTVEELGGCSHDGGTADTGHMTGLADEVAAEVDAHVEAMGLAADLDAAMAEEDRHAAAMADLMGGMASEHDEMMEAMADHMCAAHDAHDGGAEPHHD